MRRGTTTLHGQGPRHLSRFQRAKRRIQEDLDLKPRKGYYVSFGVSKPYRSHERDFINFPGWFSGNYDPHGAFKVLLLMGLAFSMWFAGDFALGGPLFHSVAANYSPDTMTAKDQLIQLQASCQQTHVPSTCKTVSNGLTDPTYPVNRFSSPSSNLGEFNVGPGASFVSTCGWGTSSCVNMAPFGATGNLTTAASDQAISSQGLASQHTAFFEGTNWFLFYDGACGANACLNYTSATTPEGPWTEHTTGSDPFNILETTSFACDANSTTVVCAVAVHSGGNLYVNTGTVTGSQIIFKTWQTIVVGGQSQTPDVVYEHTKQQFYIAYNSANVACGPGNNAQSCSYYIVNTDSSLRNWSSSILIGYNQLPVNGLVACPGDNIQTGVDAGNGSIYMTTFAYFIANSCNANVANNRPQPRAGYFGSYLTGTSAGRVESIPTTPGFYTGFGVQDCGSQFSTGKNAGQACDFGFQDFLFTTQPNVITGIFTYAIYCSPTNNPCVGPATNTTLEMTPLFATRTVSDGWSVPARFPSDTGQFLLNADNSHLGGNAELLSFGYDNATKEYIGEHSCGAQLGSICDDVYATIFDKNFNMINPVVSMQQLTGGYTFAASGFNQFGMQPRYYPFSTNIPYFAWDGTSPTAVIHAVSFSDTGTSVVNNPLFSMVESRSPIGNLSPASAKELEVQFNWQALSVPSPICGGLECSWGLFLTTNPNLWQTATPLWTPYLDPSIALFQEQDMQSVATNRWASTVYIPTQPGTTIRAGDTGCHGNTGGSGSQFMCVSNVPNNTPTIGYTWMDLNFTGGGLGNSPSQVGSSTNCDTGAAPHGGASSCSFATIFTCNNLAGCGALPNGNEADGNTPSLPSQFSLSGNYYLGLYVGAGQLNTNIQFCFDNGNSCNSPQTFVTNGCTAASLEVDICIPNINAAQAPPTSTTDSGGFVGQAINFGSSTSNGFCSSVGIVPFVGGVLSNVCSSVVETVTTGIKSIPGDLANSFKGVVNYIINFGGDLTKALSTAIQGVGYAILGALASFFGWLIDFLNVVGQGLGFPASNNCGGSGGTCGFGDDFKTLLTYLTSLAATSLSPLIADLSQIFTSMLQLGIALATWVITWAGYMFQVIGAIVNLVTEIITILNKAFLYALYSTPLTMIMFFLIFNATDGAQGWYDYFESLAWFILLGIGLAEKFLNWLINVGVWLVNNIPEVAGTGKAGASFDLPRLPLLEHNFQLRWPNIHGRELFEGNVFSIIGMFVGTFLVIYSLGAGLFPGVTSTNVVNTINISNALLPIALVLLSVLGYLIVPVLVGQLYHMWGHGESPFHLGQTGSMQGLTITLERNKKQKPRHEGAGPRAGPKIGVRSGGAARIRGGDTGRIPQRLQAQLTEQQLRNELAMSRIRREFQSSRRQLEEFKPPPGTGKVIDIPKNGFRKVSEERG